MDFEAPIFNNAPLSQDVTKPIVALEALAPGQVIFAEVAIVASTGGDLADDCHDDGCDDEDCGGCAEVEEEQVEEGLDEVDIQEVSPFVVENYTALSETCDGLETLSMIDVRKNVLKCFHLINADSTGLDHLKNTPVPAKDAAANLDAAKILREKFSGAVPSTLSDDEVAHLIGVVNNSSFSLEDVGGSGLFYYLPKLKHSCTPNACFSDASDAIWVTAIKPIAVGEPITVDFFSAHYTSVADRQEFFADDERVCTCDVCSGLSADKTRAFKCTAAGCSGIVHPTKTEFECNTCHTKWNDDAIANAEMEETTLETDLEAETFAQLKKIIADSMLHPFHHIFYTAMDDMTHEDRVENESEAVEILNDLVNALNYVVPYPHSEKISLYNSIGQAHVSSGDIAKAKEAFTQAYHVSTIVFGAECKETIMFKGLSENTPTTVDEMAKAYGYEVVDSDEE